MTMWDSRIACYKCTSHLLYGNTRGWFMAGFAVTSFSQQSCALLAFGLAEILEKAVATVEVIAVAASV